MAESSKSPPALWNSCRLVYSICAFFCLIFQLCMRNAISFAILCMNKQAIKNSTSSTGTCGVKRLENDEDFSLLNPRSLPEGDFDWTRSQELMLLSSFYYGYLISQPIGGRLCDKFGGKPFFIFGLVAQAIAFMLVPVTAHLHYWMVVAIRTIQGIFAGIGVPSVYQLYTVWAHPSERVGLMSFAYGGFSVGSLIVFPISSMLCHVGWSSVFYIFGGISLAFGTACYWLVYSTIDTHPRISNEEFEYLNENRMAKARVPPIPWRKIVTSGPILTFIVTHFCHSYGLIILILTLPKYLSEALYFNIDANGFYSATPFVGSLTSRVIVMLTIHRIYAKSKLSLTVFRRIVYSTGNFFTTMFFIIITMLTCNERIVIVVLIGAIGMMIDVSFTGAYWISYLDIAPAFAGLLSGISNALSTLSGIVAPLLVAQIVQEGTKEEWNHVFYTIAALYAFSMILYGSFGSSKPVAWGQFLPKEDVEMPVKSNK